MSAEARSISPASFSRALEELPAENIYSKAHEIGNSIAHLEQSNKILQEYSDSIRDDESVSQETRSAGDKDCLDAIKENEVVIERQRERIKLLKAEVERRGQRWHEADPEETQPVTNGNSGEASTVSNDNHNGSQPANAQSQPRLTDEELRRQLEERLGEDMADDAEDGLHL